MSSTVPWGDPKRLLKRTGGAFLANPRHYDSHPTDPENDTDIDQCVQRLLDNDPTLKEINMNNMKRTPIPQLRRLLEALAYNDYCERLSLANMGLSDNDLAVLMPVLEINTGLKKLNLETNYLSGGFLIKFFQSALVNQTLEEVKASNQVRPSLQNY
ncbi:Tropomodulin, partial [Trichostrongylus colubriformis]